LTLLRLAKAGCCDHESQIKHLKLSGRVIASVRQGLEDDGLMKSCSITDIGEDVLRQAGLSKKKSSRYGWIIQEMVCGEILQFCSILSSPPMFPGKIPDGAIKFTGLAKPDSHPVFNGSAIEENREDAEQNDKEEMLNNDTGIDKGSTISHVRLLEKPTVGYVPLTVTINSNESGEYALDFQGYNSKSFEWERRLESACMDEKNEAYRKEKDSWLNESRNTWREKHPNIMDETALTRRAQETVSKRFSILKQQDIAGIYERIMEALVVMEKERFRFEVLKDLERARYINTKRGEILENCFDIIANNILSAATVKDIHALGGDGLLNHVKSLGCDLSCQNEETRNIVNNLNSQKKEHLEALNRKDVHNLLPNLINCLKCSLPCYSSNGDEYFKRAFTINPEWLRLVFRINYKRNNFSTCHKIKEKNKYKLQNEIDNGIWNASRECEEVYAIVECLIKAQ
jgi:hypothetical protein